MSLVRSEKDAILSVQRWAAGVLVEPWDIRTDLEAGEPPERPFALVEQSGPAETSGPAVTQDLIVPMTVNLYLPKAATREAATDAALNLREAVWVAVKVGPDRHHPTTDRLPLYCYEPRVEQHRLSVPSTAAHAVITVAGHQTAQVLPTATAAEVAAAVGAAIGATAGDVVGQDRGSGLWDVFYTGALAGERIGDPTIDVGTARTILEGAPSPWRGPSDYMRVQSFSQNTVRDAADPTLVMVAVDLRLTFARGLPLPLELRIIQRVNATVGSGPRGH